MSGLARVGLRESVDQTADEARVEAGVIEPSPEPIARGLYARPAAPTLQLCEPDAHQAEFPEASEVAEPPSSDDETFEPCPSTVKTPRWPRLPVERPSESESLPAPAAEFAADPAPEPEPEREPEPRDAEIDSEREAALSATQRVIEPDEGVSDEDFEREFFRFESFPPVVAEVQAPESASLLDLDSGVNPPELSAVQIARRHSLRRYVGLAMAVAAVLVVGASIKAAVGSGSPDGPVQAALLAPLTAQGPLQQAAAATVAPLVEKRPAGRVQAANPFMDDAPPATDEAAKDAEQADLEPSGQAVAELRATTVQLLSQYKLAEAIVSARALIKAEPDSAFGYLCLGAGFQDQGKVQQARQAYSECVRHAKYGSIGECAALGGRR